MSRGGSGPGSHRAPASLADAARATPQGPAAESARAEQEPEGEGGEPGLEPREVAASSLTLVVFLWNVHPRIFIDH